MNNICNAGLVNYIKSCFSYKKNNETNYQIKHNEKSIESESLVDELRATKYNADQFIRTLVKNPLLILNNLLELEDQIDKGNFIEIVNTFTTKTIERNVADINTQAYLHYIVLKVKIIAYNKQISMKNIINKKDNFNTERVISTFLQNLIFLKNVHSYIVFEDKGEGYVKTLTSRRLSFFEWLSEKIFKLLLIFCCNIDHCNDNKALVNMCLNIKDYYDICERYLIAAYTYSTSNQQRDKLKSFIEVYTKELLTYIKMLSYNKENQSPVDEIKTLEFINLAVNRLLQQHPLIFIKFKHGFEDFETRVKDLKAKYTLQFKQIETEGKKRPSSENNVDQVINQSEENSMDDSELDDDILELFNEEQKNRLSTIREMSSRYEKQSGGFEGPDDEFNKLDMRKRPMVRRSSFSKLNKVDVNFI